VITVASLYGLLNIVMFLHYHPLTVCHLE